MENMYSIKEIHFLVILMYNDCKYIERKKQHVHESGCLNTGQKERTSQIIIVESRGP